MAINVSSLTVDVLTRSTESPEPIPLPRVFGSTPSSPGMWIPINPMSFPNDWSVEVSLETRWQTDTTRPSHGNRPEKWSLASRPARMQTVRVVGVGKEEAHALLQAGLAHTGQFGVPVPLYCDVSPLKDIVGTRLFGDFRFRRFFVGGRVAIFPSLIVPIKSANSTIYAIIKELTPTEMLVEFDAATTRTPTLKDGVAPCMDVEFVDTVSGISQTDALYEVTLTWREVEGACSLPGIWPPTAFNSADVLSPFCTIVDNLPVFPFDFNWAEGVSIEPVRSIDSSNSGRSTIQEPRGQAYLRFSINLMGYDRARSWNILRFFDSMQGRFGTFYFLHPHMPWTLLTVPSVSALRIKPIGDAYQIQTYFSKVAVFRADGTFITRTISSAEDLGPQFQLNLSADLPDTSFVAVQPIFEASFEQDSLTEAWATSEVIPSMEFSIITEPDRGEVALSEGIAFVERDTELLSIPGCTLFARAGAGCSFGAVESFAWPAYTEVVTRWKDFSNTSLVPKTLSTAGISGSASSCCLIRFPYRNQNNGQIVIKDPWFNLPEQLDATLPIADRHLWGPTGWTVTLCFTPQAHLTPQENRDLMRVDWGSSNYVEFVCDRPGVSGADRAAVRRSYNGTVLAAPLTVDIATLPYAVYVTLHWVGDTLRVWVNGEKALAAAAVGGPGNSGIKLQLSPMPTGYFDSGWFRGFFHNQATTSTHIRQRFGVLGCANLVVSYNRPLDIDEINQVHSAIAAMFQTSREVSTLYA